MLWNIWAERGLPPPFYAWLTALLLMPQVLAAQNRPQPGRQSPTTPVSQPQTAQTSTGTQRPDAFSAPRDSGRTASALPPAPKDAVRFFAADSANFLLGDTTRVFLFGSASLDHESGKLRASTVSLNTTTQVMEAKAASETDTLGRPVLERATDNVRSNRILYNYNTGRGKFEAARVNISEGALLGNQVKRADEHIVYVADGVYSTCTLDHPHFYIRARRMKVVNEEEIFFTRARLYLLDIPYPLILPFGYVPAKWDQKRSGLLAPTFMNQATTTRGYGLNNLGWFQYFNDYLTGVFAFGVYTSGTWNSDLRLNYSRNGRYSGNIRFGSSSERGLESTDPGFKTAQRSDRWLNITHAYTISPWARFNADINLRTSKYFQNNSTNLDELARVTAGSKASWSYSQPDGAYNISTSIQQNQNFQTGNTSISGPSINFTARRFTPFASSTRSSGANAPFYESLAIGYSNNFQSNFQYQPTDSAGAGWYDVLFNPSLYRQSNDFTKVSPTKRTPIDAGLAHRININSKLLPGRFMQLNGSFNINEYWLPSTIEKTWNPETRKVETTTVGGFAAARDFNAGLSFNTTVYGISNRKIGRLNGFRHTMRPSMGFSYRPDFSDDSWGYYKKVQNDTTGTRFETYSRFLGSVVGGPSAGESRSINLSLDNIFETRLTRRDTTGETRSEVIRLIDNLQLSTAYNFAAPSKKLSPLQASASANIFRSMNFNFGASFSFYGTDSTGREIDRYLWNQSNRPFRMTSFSFNTGTQFSEGSMMPSPEVFYHPEFYDPLQQNMFRPYDTREARQRFQAWSIPWSVGINFTYSWSRSNPNVKPDERAVVNFSGIQTLLTPKWRVGTSLGYDFITKEPTPPVININRNLHCWDLSMTWAPYGPYKYFVFQLNVNSGQFRNLFQKLPGLNNLNSSSGRNSRF